MFKSWKIWSFYISKPNMGLAKCKLAEIQIWFWKLLFLKTSTRFLKDSCRNLSRKCLKNDDFPCWSKFSQKVSKNQNFAIIFYFEALLDFPKGFQLLVHHETARKLDFAISTQKSACERGSFMIFLSLKFIRKNYKLFKLMELE